jgi:hypothetical protein
LADPNASLDVELDQYSLPNWVVSPSTSHDFINNVLPLDEAIMESMALGDRPWEDSHNGSFFLPDSERVEKHIQTLVSTHLVDHPQSLIYTQDVSI